METIVRRNNARKYIRGTGDLTVFIFSRVRVQISRCGPCVKTLIDAQAISRATPEIVVVIQPPPTRKRYRQILLKSYKDHNEVESTSEYILQMHKTASPMAISSV